MADFDIDDLFNTTQNLSTGLFEELPDLMDILEEDLSSLSEHPTSPPSDSLGLFTDYEAQFVLDNNRGSGDQQMNSLGDIYQLENMPMAADQFGSGDVFYPNNVMLPMANETPYLSHSDDSLSPLSGSEFLDPNLSPQQVLVNDALMAPTLHELLQRPNMLQQPPPQQQCVVSAGYSQQPAVNQATNAQLKITNQEQLQALLKMGAKLVQQADGTIALQLPTSKQTGLENTLCNQVCPETVGQLDRNLRDQEELLEKAKTIKTTTASTLQQLLQKQRQLNEQAQHLLVDTSPTPQVHRLPAKEPVMITRQSFLPTPGNGGTLISLPTIKPEPRSPPNTCCLKLTLPAASSRNTSARGGGSRRTQNMVSSSASLAVTTLTSSGKLAITEIDEIPVSMVTSGGGRPKVVRKSTHNVIEKKYRLSINDKILELRDLLYGEDTKCNKSGILRKAIDQIKLLSTHNARLKQENSMLKMELERWRCKAAVGTGSSLQRAPDSVGYPNTYSSSGDEYISSPASSPPSNLLAASVASPSSSTTSSDLDYPQQHASNSYMAMFGAGVAERTKILLCMTMFGLLFCDPLGLLVNSAFPGDSVSASGDYGTMHQGARVLQATQEQVLSAPGWSRACVLALNTLIFLLLACKVFVFGQPRILPGSKQHSEFVKWNNQAEMDSRAGDYSNASKHLKMGLHALGRPIPVSLLDVLSSIIWHTSSYALQRVRLGRWLLRQSLGIRGVHKAKVEDVEPTLCVVRDAAMAYHRLHQLAVSGLTDSTSLSCLVYGLTSVSLGDLSYPAMKPLACTLAQLHFTAAVSALKCLPTPLGRILARYFVYEGRLTATGHGSSAPSLLPPRMAWLCTTRGYLFFKRTSWINHTSTSVFSTCLDVTDPLEHISQAYREYLLAEALAIALNPSTELPISVAVDLAKAVLAFNERASPTCISFGAASKGFVAELRRDQLSSWWACLISLYCHYMTSGVARLDDGGRDDSSSFRGELERSLSDMPASLKSIEIPLAGALVESFKAHGLLLDTLDSGCAFHTTKSATSFRQHDYGRQLSIGTSPMTVTSLCEAVLNRCDRGGFLLADSLSAPTPSGTPARIHLLAQLMCADLLLRSRVLVWKRVTSTGDIAQQVPAIKEDLDAFHRDVETLRSVVTLYPRARNKLFLYQGVGRMMSGANYFNTRLFLAHHFRESPYIKQSTAKERNTKTSEEHSDDLAAGICSEARQAHALLRRQKEDLLLSSNPSRLSKD